LSLTVAQHVLVKRCVQTAVLLDRLPQADETERFKDGRRGVGVEWIEVLADGAGEDELVLRDGDETGADRFSRKGREGEAVDGDGS
jgi:hypothetical protein